MTTGAVPAATGKVKVILIAGAGRSGSTLLANVLGSVDGVFSAGEVRYLGERGLRDQRLCGCGVAFPDCPIWREALERAGLGRSDLDVDALVAGARVDGRVRNVPHLISAEARRRRGQAPTPASSGPEDRWQGLLNRLYPALRDVTGCPVIVDSSKFPAHGALLERLDTVDLMVIHLVRDPRATAFSWGRAKPLTDGAASTTMQQMSPGRSALLWNVWNATTRVLWGDGSGHLRLRYEEFIARPRACVKEILELAGHATDLGSVFADERTVRIGVTHTVAGNPNRLRRGPITIRLDDEWLSAMPRGERALVTALTSPLLHSFGYPVRPAPAPMA